MTRFIKKGIFFIMTALVALPSWAQDEKKLDVDINVNKNDSNWYQQPWVWIVGAAVFIIIIVAILKGGGKKE